MPDIYPIILFTQEHISIEFIAHALLAYGESKISPTYNHPSTANKTPILFSSSAYGGSKAFQLATLEECLRPFRHSGL
ncbi:MAG TPA: hypothetical protein VJC37_00930 [Planctomycetota bacterium]|nr:hypothetical protein [Planctomycetota bacterium]